MSLEYFNLIEGLFIISYLVLDIIKQTNAHSYKVKTSDGIAICKLVASGSPAVNQAYINATDSTGHTYYVTKLTAHRALLVPYGSAGHEFPSIGTRPDGTTIYQTAKWNFTGAVASSSVVVDNA